MNILITLYHNNCPKSDSPAISPAMKYNGIDFVCIRCGDTVSVGISNDQN